MDYEYKQLSGSDIVLIKKLLRVFGEAFEDLPTYQNAIPSEAYLRSLLSKPHFFVLVAISGNEVVERSAVGVEQSRLITGRQEAAGEGLQPAARNDAKTEDDEAREVAILAAETVTDP